MCHSQANHNVDAFVFLLASTFEHGIRLSNTRGITKKDLQATTSFWRHTVENPYKFNREKKVSKILARSL